MQDCDLTIGCLLRMCALYKECFGIDVLGGSFTSAGAIVTSHLEKKINEGGVIGFTQCRNGTIGRLLLAARTGGITEARCHLADKIRERGQPEADVAKVVALDFTSLYPSTLSDFPSNYGEATLYSPAEDSGGEVLKAASNFNPYSNEYRACELLKFEIADRYGEELLSIRSNTTNERVAVLPRYWPDAFAVSTRGDGKVVLSMLMHDGFYHVREKGLHHENCRFNKGEENDFMNSDDYVKTLAMAEKHKRFCGAVFAAEDFELRFVQTTDCAFHSPYVLSGGARFRDAGAVVDHARLARPEMCVAAAHPPAISLSEVLSPKPRPDGTVLTGFIVLK